MGSLRTRALPSETLPPRQRPLFHLVVDPFLKHTSTLHAAVVRDNDADALPLMQLLLGNGIDVNELEYEGRDRLPRGASLRDHRIALHVAAREGSVERVKVLVEGGADLGRKSKNGYPARD